MRSHTENFLNTLLMNLRGKNQTLLFTQIIVLRLLLIYFAFSESKYWYCLISSTLCFSLARFDKFALQFSILERDPPRFIWSHSRRSESRLFTLRWAQHINSVWSLWWCWGLGAKNTRAGWCFRAEFPISVFQVQQRANCYIQTCTRWVWNRTHILDNVECAICRNHLLVAYSIFASFMGVSVCVWVCAWWVELSQGCQCFEF